MRPMVLPPTLAASSRGPIGPPPTPADGARRLTVPLSALLRPWSVDGSDGFGSSQPRGGANGVFVAGSLLSGGLLMQLEP